MYACIARCHSLIFAQGRLSGSVIYEVYLAGPWDPLTCGCDHPTRIMICK